MASAVNLQFAPEVSSAYIHDIAVGEYFSSPFNGDGSIEVLIRTASGATSICTGEEYPTALFEIEEEEDEAEDDEYLLELIPAGNLTLVIE